MDATRVRVIRQSCAPKTFPCPRCGTPGRRKDTHTRPVRDIAYGEILIIELTVGEYRAACDCCKTFRSHVEGIESRAEYTNRVRDAVIDRLLDDGMSLHRLQQAMRRDFLLDLSDGFLPDCLDGKVRRADPDLAKVLAMLGPEKFGKMMAFLHSPGAERVRTNNHVERTNRRLRYFEKVRYKWRRRTIVRFVVLALDRRRNQRVVKEQGAAGLIRKPQAPRRTKQAT